MNVVLYTRDFEPITVLDLPQWLLDKAEQKGRVTLAVNAKLPDGKLPVITVYCKKMLWYDGMLKPILITDDEVLVLALSPAWLPGQTQAVQSTKTMLRKLHSKVLELMRKN